MNNGCICCTVRGDLIRIVGGLMKRRDKFDGIIIETTGLANPAPVAQTFFVDEDVKRAKTRLDAIVTVVDAKHLPARLADSQEAVEQIAFADVIVLNKTDLVTPDGVRARSSAASAPSTPSPRSTARTRADVPIDAGDRPRRLRPEAHARARARVPRPRTTTSITTTSSRVTFEVEQPIDPEKFNAWIGPLLAAEGPGPAAHQGHPVYAERRPPLRLPGGAHDRRWRLHRPGEGGRPAQVASIVFIGRDLNRPQLRRGFESCQADVSAHERDRGSPTSCWNARHTPRELGACGRRGLASRRDGSLAFALGDGTVRIAQPRRRTTLASSRGA